jgi:lactate dehydrogenase-like 2-hydroxyacid dehydrogenase
MVKRLALLAGNIGTAFAKIVLGFGCKVVALM